jgi:hypothetical protein
MLAASDADVILWRNNVGTGYTGRVIHKTTNSITLADPRVITFGLCVGSSDLIGITPAGQFVALEVKTKNGRPTKEQQNYIDVIKKRGGLAGVARTETEALQIINNR